MNNVSIVIPARWSSSRFTGKPLSKINGKEMILWVADGCAPAFGKDVVYVVTDDDRTSNCVTKHGYRVIMTRKDQAFHTGTDRVAYAAKFLDSEYIINVQGDEPLVNYEDIRRVSAEQLFSVINCYQKIYDGREIESRNTIKMITNKDDELLYASREPIPLFANGHKKQVGIYMFKRHNLLELYGENKKKGILEVGEDVEILRILDSGDDVYMVEVAGNYQSVDVSEDIEKVERILNAKKSI
jgi:3-deoxy-manno-octulosonate cytidylyltransferase (CMP-KDO synthetase)